MAVYDYVPSLEIETTCFSPHRLLLGVVTFGRLLEEAVEVVEGIRLLGCSSRHRLQSPTQSLPSVLELRPVLVHIVVLFVPFHEDEEKMGQKENISYMSFFSCFEGKNGVSTISYLLRDAFLRIFFRLLLRFQVDLLQFGLRRCSFKKRKREY